ncbi:protocadherin gamma subfamily A, 3 L homeolog isoform X11 [Xenopus laevis]|uniref:Protocadherin gamma subfamily A, 3 L homeolog isoform X11 n=1 Tax=Xenopus laevis TaxID=8355 RepID=A0A8J1MIE6_XENLA|nr:protocadherin gamma subfamily A, 3 L homeolog isoform X11 [Xenopus laevis]
MDIQSSATAWKWQVVYSFLLCSWGWVSGQIAFSVGEETEPGSVVGNVAQILGINPADISKRRLHLGSERSRGHFSLNPANGDLTVKERIDRESLCGSSSTCVLPIEIVAENPLELYSLEIEIIDINDNSPIFSVSDHIIKITELLTNPGVRFPLEIAYDPDVGKNGINQYKLSPTPYFSLSLKSRMDGTLIPELVLETVLDREEKEEHRLILTALDGGEPPRSGSCHITVNVLDINDNPPVFEKSNVKVKLLENPKLNTVLTTLNATDLDEGRNGEIEYYFDSHTSESAKELFYLDSQTGEIYIKGIVDYEESHFHELSIRAKDKGVPEMEGQCQLQVVVEDANDNPPEIILTSTSTDVPENAALETAVAFFTVKDKDSGKNGEVTLTLSPNLPFKIKPLKNHYSLVTDQLLDREKISQYVIQMTAKDLGSPTLQTHVAFSLNISDINDNPPLFLQANYDAILHENKEPGSFLCAVSAFDSDEGINAELTYSIVNSNIDVFSVSSFVYIDPKNGNVYSQRAFDYENIQVFKITVRVEDSGSPKLFSNATVSIFILDVNDNYPTLLYPKYTRELIIDERIPNSASPGYLVTKLSAVDLDSGHNAWLLFSLVDDTDTTLFKVSAHTGEIRTIRELQETDYKEQRLVTSISDHGEPPLSTTVIILVNVIENTEEKNPKPQDFLTNSKPASDLTLYLIVSLVAISLVSLITFIILIVKCLNKATYGNSSVCCFTSRSYSDQYADQYKPTLYLNTDGTLKYMEVRMVPTDLQGQCYQNCFQTAAETPNVSIMKAQPFPQLNDSVNENKGCVDTNCLNDTQQAQPNADWRFSQAAQKPGPSGTQPTEEAGVWPNNQFETERLQAMILASANEAAEGTSGLGGGTGTMGLSARYGPQFTLQHVPDYRQNVYIPGSTLTPTNGGGKREGKGNKKKSSKKDKK